MQMRILKDVPPARIFLLIAPVIFAAYALLTPPFQTPDEQQHLFRAWQLSELHLLGERRGNQAGGVVPESLGRAALPELRTLNPHVKRIVVKRPFDSLFNTATPLDAGGPRRFFDFPGAVLFSPVGYIPQVVSIWIGNAAGLSVEGILRLGRLLNAALAIFLIYCSIRITPVGALAFASVGLLPMTAAASAAFGQDGLAIGAACLLTAVGLRMILNGRWQRSEVAIAGALTILLSLSKILYLPLAMVGGQPLLGRGIQWRRLFVPMLICAVSAALTGLWVHTVSELVVPFRTDVPTPSEQLARWVYHPTELWLLLEQTFVAHGVKLYDTLFRFGWQNVGPVRAAEFLCTGAFLLVIIRGDPAAARLDYRTRLWLLAIAVLIVFLVSVTVSLYWTRPFDTWIRGLQARYFIPVAPMVLTALLAKRDGEGPYGIFVALLMIGANLASLVFIVAAFYG